MSTKLNLDDDQFFKLKKFRRCVSDILQSKHDDRFLLRWLRARSWDIAAAEKMLRKCMETKKEWDVEYLLRTWTPPEPLASYYCSGQCGFDMEGHPIYIFPMENLDIVGIIHTSSKQDIVRLAYKKIEETLELAEARGQYQMVILFDLENFNLKQFAWKPAVELVITLLQMYEANYPEILYVCYIINAPKFFALAYSIIKKFINEYTQSKIKIYKQESQKWRTAIMEHVTPDNLPKHYGGTMVDPDGNPKCPSKVKQASQVPKHLYKKNLTEETILKREYTTTTIKKGKQLVLDFYVSETGCFLHWDFRSEDHDIRFGVSYTDEDGKAHTVIKSSRTAANIIDVSGTVSCRAPATYTVTFDNSYSMFRSKVIHYYIDVTESLNNLVIDNGENEKDNFCTNGTVPNQDDVVHLE